jgi:hypothetical protein
MSSFNITSKYTKEPVATDTPHEATNQNQTDPNSPADPNSGRDVTPSKNLVGPPTPSQDDNQSQTNTGNIKHSLHIVPSSKNQAHTSTTTAKETGSSSSTSTALIQQHNTTNQTEPKPTQQKKRITTKTKTSNKTQ